MNERSLLKCGGICAYVAGVIWVLCWVFYWIAQGGIPSHAPSIGAFANMVTGVYFRAVIILFGINLFIFVVVAYAIYEYLRKYSNGLAKIGFGFAFLWLIIVFMCNSLSVAAKTIVLSQGTAHEAQLFVIMSLFAGLHTPAILLWALFPFLWGLALIKLEGNNKITGYLFLATALFAVLNYVFLRIGSIWISEFSHLLGHVAFTLSFFFLGLILTTEAKKL